MNITGEEGRSFLYYH